MQWHIFVRVIFILVASCLFTLYCTTFTKPKKPFSIPLWSGSPGLDPGAFCSHFFLYVFRVCGSRLIPQRRISISGWQKLNLCDHHEGHVSLGSPFIHKCLLWCGSVFLQEVAKPPWWFEYSMLHASSGHLHSLILYLGFAVI